MPVYAAKFDNTLYDNILRSYVNAQGLVDYEGLRNSSLQDLQGYLDAAAGVKMESWVYAEKLAFWINVYNAHVLQQVLLRGDIQKIDERSGLYDAPLRVANGSYSLNDIHHRILRGKKNPANHLGPVRGVTLDISDPRVNFALCGGTLGSPRLRNVALTPETAETALREASIEFVNSPKYLAVRKKRLVISRLMDWYAADFELVGGAANYLNRLLDGKRREDAAAIQKLLLTRYGDAVFEYDPTLNDIRHAGRSLSRRRSSK
jgi:hypothetical protein